MKCLNCEYEIENDDNFCPNCGHWTARGYNLLNDEAYVDTFMNGYEIKKNNKLSILFTIVFISIITFVVTLIIRGNNLFKPIIYIKKRIDSYNYGYNISVIKTDNSYNKISISDIDNAYDSIKNDFAKQKWKCMQDFDVYKIEKTLEEECSIPSVVFCDISLDEATKIEEVIMNIYKLFPNIKEGLTNVTISNAPEKADYIVYFQPMYQFVNSNEDIKKYNKVNKSQILLNSYYFLNEEMLNKNIDNVVGEDWYVKDATCESIIAHELGHYITFKLFLKEKNVESITIVTDDNEEYINSIMKEYDSGIFSTKILEEALSNYHEKYNSNIDINEFAENISKYAATRDKSEKLIADETIAEAIHDYYLHGNNCKRESNEIVKIIQNRL